MTVSAVELEQIKRTVLKKTLACHATLDESKMAIRSKVNEMLQNLRRVSSLIIKVRTSLNDPTSSIRRETLEAEMLALTTKKNHLETSLLKTLQIARKKVSSTQDECTKKLYEAIEHETSIACANCHKPKFFVVLKRCARCLKVLYCSPACQTIAWGVHRTVCVSE